MTSYLCSVCGTLALPTNSDLVDGMKFVHRACQEQPKPDRTHSFLCDDPDYCRGECLPEPPSEPYDSDLVETLTKRYLANERGPSGLFVDLYGDPLQDREPMGGSPFWAEERDL